MYKKKFRMSNFLFHMADPTSYLYINAIIRVKPICILSPCRTIFETRIMEIIETS